MMVSEQVLRPGPAGHLRSTTDLLQDQHNRAINVQSELPL